MATDQVTFDLLLQAIEAALAGDWDHTHGIVQKLEGDPIANWLHAVLHKHTGETENARYWYSLCPMDFDRFTDTKVELRAIFHTLTEPEPASGSKS